MASFLSGLFGRFLGNNAQEEAPRRSDKAETYKDYIIHPLPQQAQGQWRLAGVIVKAGEDGEEEERAFVRADTFPSQEDAEKFSLRKGQQIIDERGDSLFAASSADSRL